MSNYGRSVLATSNLTTEQVHSIFRSADEFQKQPQKLPPLTRSMICAFLEPSTRTRMSFQMAGLRVGVQTVSFDAAQSSLSKGETLSDTVLNLVSMQPDLFVIRYGESVELDRLLPTLDVPVISGGSGKASHPTQALLDAYTILKERGKLSGERVFIIGDIVHSRVARSDYELLTRLGCEVGFGGPKELLPIAAEFPQAKFFSSTEDGIRWATVLMGLRIQLERHTSTLGLDEASYQAEFGINSRVLKNFANDGIIMHPGPVRQGVEFAPEVLHDPRCRVLAQVTNGVAVRAALIQKVIGVG